MEGPKLKRIEGVRVGNSEKKNMQYADDTELLVTDDESINQIFFELKCYETGTGEKVNAEKNRGLMTWFMQRKTR